MCSDDIRGEPRGHGEQLQAPLQRRRTHQEKCLRRRSADVPNSQAAQVRSQFNDSWQLEGCNVVEGFVQAPQRLCGPPPDGRGSCSLGDINFAVPHSATPSREQQLHRLRCERVRPASATTTRATAGPGNVDAADESPRQALRSEPAQHIRAAEQHEGQAQGTEDQEQQNSSLRLRLLGHGQVQHASDDAKRVREQRQVLPVRLRVLVHLPQRQQPQHASNAVGPIERPLAVPKFVAAPALGVIARIPWSFNVADRRDWPMRPSQSL
mmetsp:Transcript_135032/g.431476  ORF Transcript_135032/g.431476 Transcript_135032/m.431476 type:complete len:267 (+) Transcript_135032:1452-2252(+)